MIVDIARSVMLYVAVRYTYTQHTKRMCIICWCSSRSLFNESNIAGCYLVLRNVKSNRMVITYDVVKFHVKTLWKCIEIAFIVHTMIEYCFAAGKSKYWEVRLHDGKGLNSPLNPVDRSWLVYSSYLFGSSDMWPSCGMRMLNPPTLSGTDLGFL
jgi:hypothetical protein